MGSRIARDPLSARYVVFSRRARCSVRRNLALRMDSRHLLPPIPPSHTVVQIPKMLSSWTLAAIVVLLAAGAADGAKCATLATNSDGLYIITESDADYDACLVSAPHHLRSPSAAPCHQQFSTPPARRLRPRLAHAPRAPRPAPPRPYAPRAPRAPHAPPTRTTTNPLYNNPRITYGRHTHAHKPPRLPTTKGAQPRRHLRSLPAVDRSPPHIEHRNDFACDPDVASQPL